MWTFVIILYCAAIVLLILAGLRVASQFSLALFGAACALAAFSIPIIAAHN